jgi:hypothetical protein
VEDECIPAGRRQYKRPLLAGMGEVNDSKETLSNKCVLVVPLRQKQNQNILP